MANILCQEQHLGGSGHLETLKNLNVMGDSPVQCGKRCTINSGNGDRLSARKIVKNKVNIEWRFYRAT